ncbi:hypothetical protein [Corynebacterium bovis]|uniref:hypothetical protein n=1 Tax=Corynebacterium bovis TaxID=36808 RepID=UPI000F645D00|nr:hypothetical protein [Corynebacterium bovis]RRQ19818.1 hypothetical protein CXF33_00060 [Corynebacterium bovis]
MVQMNTVNLDRVESTPQARPSTGANRGAGGPGEDIVDRFNRLTDHPDARRRGRWMVLPLLAAGLALVGVPVVFTTMRLGATTQASWPVAAGGVVVTGVIAGAARSQVTDPRRGGDRRWAGPVAVGVGVSVLLWAAVLTAWAVLAT